MHSLRFIQLPTLALFLALAACVDTTGLTSTLHQSEHPDSTAGAAVIVREYSDLQCPSCRGANLQLNPALLQKYGKDIRFEFTHFPLQTLHPNALLAAEASECAADQGKFWEFIDLVYQEQDKLSPDQLTIWAQQLKLDMDLFGRCTASRIKRSSILAEYGQGVKQGISGTPTYMVDGKIVPSTLGDIGKAIEEGMTTSRQRL